MAKRSSKTEVVMSADDSDIMRKYKAQQKEIKNYEQLLTKMGKAGTAGFTKVEKGADRARKSIRGAGKEQSKGFGRQALMKLTAFAGGFIGVSAALGVVNRTWETWITNVREFSTEVQKASNDMIAFVALQEKGTKQERAIRVAELAAQFNIEFGEAFETVQALQSAAQAQRPGITREEAFRTGMAASTTVFAAARVGVPAELGREAAIQGAQQGMAPGEMMRMLFVAGQESARTPGLLATGARELMQFDDKAFGAAVAAELAGPFEKELKTFLKQAGLGLGRTGAAAEFFEAEGLAQASRQEKLGFLFERGLTTVEKLTEVAGVTEIRQAQALAVAARGFEAIKLRKGVIEKEAVPGLLVRQRAEVEAEVPSTKVTREIEELKAKLQFEQAFTPAGLQKTEAERENFVRGLAFRRLGLEQALFFDLIDKEKGTTQLDRFLAELLKTITRPGLGEEILATMEEIRKELKEGGPANINIGVQKNIGALPSGGQAGVKSGNTLHEMGVG